MPDYLSQLLPEERFLFSLCRLNFNDLQKQQVREFVSQVKDWNKFIRLSNDHGLISLCNYNLMEYRNNSIIPTEYLVKLQNGYYTSLIRNTAILKLLNTVLKLASENFIKIVLIKGIALEKTVYRNKGLRQMNDLDILVRKDDAIKLRNLLLQKEFVSIPVVSPLHEKILPYYGKHLPEMNKDGISVEIHFRLFDQSGDNLTSCFLEKSTTISGEEYPYSIPCPQLHFLYLIKHLEKHESVGSSQIRLYNDLAILLSDYKNTVLNETLLEYAKEAGLIGALIEKLFILKTFWGIKMPDYFLESAELPEKEKSIKKFTYFLRHPKEHHDDLKRDSLLKPIKDINGILNKSLFIFGYIFPSFVFMRYRYGVNSPLKTLLFYPIRWGKLVKLVLARTL